MGHVLYRRNFQDVIECHVVR